MSRALDFANDISTLESKFSGDTLSNVVIDAGQILGTDIDTLENAGPYIPVNITNPTDTQILAFNNGVLINQDQIEATSSNVDHDLLTNFVANEHIDWTNATENFSTSGTLGVGNNALVVDSSGNVGVGTSSPTSAVTIREDSSGSKVELLRLENLGGGSNEGALIGFYSDNGKYAEIETSHSTYNYGNLELRAYDNDHTTIASRIRLSGTEGTNDSPYISFTTGNSQRMRIDSVGQINMYDVYSQTVSAGQPQPLYIASTGKLGQQASIRAAKTNINVLDSIEWVYDLNPVSFNYRIEDDEGNYTDIPETSLQYGLIAEDVEFVNPELAFYIESENGMELRGVQYHKLTAPLIKAVQQQKELIESQQSQIDALTARIEALESN